MKKPRCVIELPARKEHLLRGNLVDLVAFILVPFTEPFFRQWLQAHVVLVKDLDEWPHDFVPTIEQTLEEAEMTDREKDLEGVMVVLFNLDRGLFRFLETAGEHDLEDAVSILVPVS